jgi:hypothetical protein
MESFEKVNQGRKGSIPRGLLDALENSPHPE